jgi:murein DD-endopeptidase MepM/ murein hydrolase activator NlpD
MLKLQSILLAVPLTVMSALYSGAAHAQALFCNPTTRNPLQGFLDPVDGTGTLTSAHSNPYQYADDIGFPSMGTPVKNMRDGTVVYTQDGFPDSGGGEGNFKRANLVVVRYDDGPDCGALAGDKKYYSLYLHFKKGSVRVQKGQKIAAGTIIGEVGNSGWSTGPHLHVETNLSTGPQWWQRNTVPYIWTSGRNK